MKKFLLSFAALFVTAITLHAQVAAKTLVKSFNLDDKGTIVLELPGSVEVKTWDTPIIRIEISIGLASGNSAMLNELANVGRYNLTAKPNDEALQIQMPNMQKQVKVKGEILKEVLTFVVYTPKDIKVQAINTQSLLVSATPQ
jgi:hypothetical protein